MLRNPQDVLLNVVAQLVCLHHFFRYSRIVFPLTRGAIKKGGVRKRDVEGLA